MKKVDFCHKCNMKVHGYVHYKPEIGDSIVITNNFTSHDIPIGTVMEVKHIYPGGFGGTVVMDYEISPTNELMDNGIAILPCDYTVINTQMDKES